jgi:alkanesulfonate monooxygenase SsuD/methylene tetrahydromethanopterin reductase-like flavin-dependent oxidoreductase (luciferase family)
MRLGYFTMPVHPMERKWQETLQEDREAIIFADQLGFYDAFVGEHLTDKCETITSSLLFLATLIGSTHKIKLATGTSNLSHSHPLLLASHAAMFDHLASGRFIFGISPGALTTDAEALGILSEDRNRMFAESIDVILAIWATDPPYNIDLPNNRFRVSTLKTQDLALGLGYLSKPFQHPRPEIVGTVVTPHSVGVELMGKRDFHPLSANFLLPMHLRSHWECYCRGKSEVGHEANSDDWRIARTIFVNDDGSTASRYGRDDAGSPYRFYWSQLLSKLRRGKRLYLFKSRPDQPDEEITLDYVLDNCMITGEPEEIVEKILALRELTGDFGEIVYAGVDWTDKHLAKRSMQLMAEYVMPRVNAAIER